MLDQELNKPTKESLSNFANSKIYLLPNLTSKFQSELQIPIIHSIMLEQQLNKAKYLCQILQAAKFIFQFIQFTQSRLTEK